jgi:hypothetical protein
MCPWMREYLSFLGSDMLLRRLVGNCFCFVSVGISVARLPVRASVLVLPLFTFIRLDSFFEDVYIFPTVARCLVGPLKSGRFLCRFETREAFFRVEGNRTSLVPASGQISKHLAKIIGHHYTLHRIPTLSGSY